MSVEISVSEGRSISRIITFDDFGYIDSTIHDWDVTDYSFSGTATKGVDYTWGHDLSLSGLNLMFSAILDELDELNEQAVLSYSGYITWIAPGSGGTYQNLNGDLVSGTLQTEPISGSVTITIVEGDHSCDGLLAERSTLAAEVAALEIKENGLLEQRELYHQGMIEAGIAAEFAVLPAIANFIVAELGFAAQATYLVLGIIESMRTARNWDDVLDGVARPSLEQIVQTMTEDLLRGTPTEKLLGRSLQGALNYYEALTDVVPLADLALKYNKRINLIDDQLLPVQQKISASNLSIESLTAKIKGCEGRESLDITESLSSSSTSLASSGQQQALSSGLNIIQIQKILEEIVQKIKVSDADILTDLMENQDLLDALPEGAQQLVAEWNVGDFSAVDVLSKKLVGALGDYNDKVFLVGTEENDFLMSTGSEDIILGGGGSDVAVFSGDQVSFTLTVGPTFTSISDRRENQNGNDRLSDVEFLDFDTNLTGSSFDLRKFTGTQGLSELEFESFIELYIAYFNRAPDALGLNFWGTAFANGMSLEEIATRFIDQDETRATYPSTMTNTDFATAVYNNVLGRVPDQDGFNFWVKVLDEGSLGRDQFILSVLGGAKTQPGADASAAFIAQQLADRTYLENKIDIGAYFSVHKGMSDVNEANYVMSLFDGTDAGVSNAVDAINIFHQNALHPDNGDFLMPIVGILNDPFTL